MIIGVDLDNTLIELDVIKVVEKKFGVTCPKQYDWHYSNFPEEIRIEIFKLFKCPDFMCSNIEPLSGSQAAIKRLSKNNKIVLITARHDELYNKTKDLVSSYFPEIYDFNSVGIGMSKKKLFVDKKLDMWIDDNLYSCVDSMELGIKTYLVSNDRTPYNWNGRQLDNINVIEGIKEIKL